MVQNILFCMTALMVLVSTPVFADCAEDKATGTTKSSETIKRALASNAIGAEAGSTSFRVTKMSCMSCASKIRKALKTELGLMNVKVDVETKTVNVLCPAPGCSMDKITNTLAGIGYTVDTSSL